MEIIARIYNDFLTKFGVPRQSGLVETPSEIIFEKPYRSMEALRGIGGFSHLWLIWEFSLNKNTEYSPTIRPPRLGGNARVGVFASRSPYRPNPIGLSSVKLLGVEQTKDGPVLRVSGADLANGTPIYDIKPYLTYTDCHPNAVCGYTEEIDKPPLNVVFNDGVSLQKELKEAIVSVLALDPRPAYQSDPERVYGFPYAGYEIAFRVEENTARVLSVTKKEN